MRWKAKRRSEARSFNPYGINHEERMKAICWHGTGDVRYDTVPDPKIADPTDIIVRITSTAICGSDLHLYDGFMPTMQAGDVIGHEPMGEVVEVGKGVKKLKKGDRVVIPFTTACGSCWFCERQMFSLCDTSNPNAEMARTVMGQSPAALFGYSHMLGGFAGGQAEYLRVPYADVSPLKIPDGMPDEKVLFLSDIFPTGYMAAENAQIEPGETVAVWGCGPVGLFSIASAWMFKAGRVIGIDRVPERLAMARQHVKAETIDFDKQDVYETLMEMTKGRGPLHRRRRRGGPRLRLARRRHGQDQRRRHDDDRPRPRRAPSHSLLPQGRHAVDPRRVHRLPGQVPVGRAHEQGIDGEDRPDARGQIPSPAPEPHPGG
jgi:threonine dehydrogenase-like Zn-dependent dehydrogenase